MGNSNHFKHYKDKGFLSNAKTIILISARINLSYHLSLRNIRKRLRMTIITRISDMHTDMIEWRHHLHSIPELISICTKLRHLLKENCVNLV